MKFKQNVVPTTRIEIGLKLIKIVNVYQELLEMLNLQSKWVDECKIEFCTDSLELEEDEEVPEDIDDQVDDWGEYWADLYIKEYVGKKAKELDQLVREVNQEDSVFDMYDDTMIRDSWIRTVNSIIGIEPAEDFVALSEEELAKLDDTTREIYATKKGNPPFRAFLHETTSAIDISLLERPLDETLRDRFETLYNYLLVMHNNISAFCFAVFEGYKVIENEDTILASNSNTVEKLIEDQSKRLFGSDFSLSIFLGGLSKESSFAEYSVPQLYKDVILSHLPSNPKERGPLLEELHQHTNVIMQWDMVLLKHDVIALDQNYLERLALRDSGRFVCVANNDTTGIEKVSIPDDLFICKTFYNIDLLDIIDVNDVAQFLEYQEKPDCNQWYYHWIEDTLKSKLNSGFYVNEVWGDSEPLTVTEEDKAPQEALGETSEFGGI